jgi:hypothetical protein
MSARHPMMPIAIAWCVHGGLLLLMGLMLGQLAWQVRSSEWIDLMEMLGMSRYIPPVQQAVLAILPWRWALFTIGGISTAVGVVAMVRPQWSRWPLQLCGAAHLILVPWAAWASHGLLGEESTGLGAVAVEVISTIIVEVGIVMLMVQVERIQRQGSTPAPIP